MTARIDIEAVTKTYGATCALDDVTLSVDAGEYCVLLGPSGCGKTTLLNIIGGFADPSAGAVRIGGRNMVGIPASQRPTTTVFQDYALFPHMTLTENVAFGLRMRRARRADRYRKAENMLALVNLGGFGAKRPSQLSGGQRQRVALARALAVNPDVLLLDEPLGALDLNLRRAMQEELKDIQRRVGATFVHVTHDQEEAMAIADRMVVMNAGRIEDHGPPEQVYRRPASRFAAAFLGEMNFLPATVQDGRALTEFGPIGPVLDDPNGTRKLACMRPEHLTPAGTHRIVGGCIVSAVFQGAHRKVRVKPDGGSDTTLLALLPVGMEAEPGDKLDLGIDPENVIVLNEVHAK